VWDKARPPIDEKCPPGLKVLMEKCWADFKERPNFNKLFWT